jgi:hypothetical protein
MGFYADHYRRIYARCLLTRRPFGSIYGGASPRSYRWYRETVQPLHDGSGLLVTHHLLQALPRTEAGRYDAGVHRNPDGLVLQCCHCGRVRNERKPGLWEWLPELEDDCPEDAISHGICPRCLDTYYQDLLPV